MYSVAWGVLKFTWWIVHFHRRQPRQTLSKLGKERKDIWEENEKKRNAKEREKNRKRETGRQINRQKDR